MNDESAEYAVLWLAPICEGCRTAQPGECSTPGCAFIRMRPPEWPLDLLELLPANEIRRLVAAAHDYGDAVAHQYADAEREIGEMRVGDEQA